MSKQSPGIEAFADYLRRLEARVAQLEAVAPAAWTSDEAAADDGAEAVLRVTDADIRAAYRLILNREPDPDGFAYYRARAADAEFTPGDLIQGLSDSDEHIARRAAQIETVEVAGVQVSVDSSELEFGRTIARDGMWEAHIIGQVKANLKPGAVFVDIGANIGVMSLQAAKAVGETGRVIAFEPNPDNVQRLLAGVLLNGFSQRVIVHPLAASDRREIFSIRGSSNTHVTAAGLGGRLVPSLPADGLLAGEARIDLIKLDIEGHEPRALAGLSATLAKHKPRLICEFNPRCLRHNLAMDPAAFADQLFDLSDDVQIIEHDGTLTRAVTSRNLTDLWDQRNAEHVTAGDLPDGLLHFDLLVQLR